MSRLKQIMAIFCVIFAGVLMMGASSCDPEDTFATLMDPDAAAEMAKPAEYVVSIHKIIRYPRSEMIELQIPSYFGDDIVVNRNYYLHSKEITKIDIVERKNEPGFYDVVLHLTNRGQKMWIGLSVANRNTPMAFVIDGNNYRNFIPKMIMNDAEMSVMIDGPFDQATALGLQKNSERNHKKINKM